MVTHRSTNWACWCLTSQIGRDGVHSPEYGRIQSFFTAQSNTVLLALQKWVRNTVFYRRPPPCCARSSCPTCDRFAASRAKLTRCPRVLSAGSGTNVMRRRGGAPSSTSRIATSSPLRMTTNAPAKASEAGGRDATAGEERTRLWDVSDCGAGVDGVAMVPPAAQWTSGDPDTWWWEERGVRGCGDITSSTASPAAAAPTGTQVGLGAAAAARPQGPRAHGGSCTTSTRWMPGRSAPWWPVVFQATFCTVPTAAGPRLPYNSSAKGVPWPLRA